MVVVADAGMLSYLNLKALDEAHFRFIVGSRITKAPHDLAAHFRWKGTLFDDGQIIDTALAIARELQNQTGVSLKKIIQALRPLREVTMTISGHQLTATPELTPHTDAILQNLPGY